MSYGFFLDHVYIVSLFVIVLVVFVAFLLFQYAHRLAEKSRIKSQFVGFGPQLALIVLVGFWLNNFYGDAREWDKRKWDIRHDHYIRLQPLLREDADIFLEFARRATINGRVAGFNGSALEDVALLFKADVLRPDLANHYPPYWKERGKLMEDVKRHDTAFRETATRVSKTLTLPSYAETRRFELARAYLEKCLGKGPGFTLQASSGSYSYSLSGGSGGSGGAPVPKDLLAAFNAFKAISPDSETTAQCNALIEGASKIVSNAQALSVEAKLMVEKPVLEGDCEYTKLD